MHSIYYVTFVAAFEAANAENCDTVYRLEQICDFRHDAEYIRKRTLRRSKQLRRIRET